MRIVRTTRKIIERGEGVIDPKIIHKGVLGTVWNDIVPGHSVYVDFGRGYGILSVSEDCLEDMPSDAEELLEMLRGKPT